MGLFFPDPLTDAKESFLTSSDGVSIAYNHYARGHKTLVILVHGWFMCKDSACFRSLASRLAQTYDVVAMDCRGHGRSGSGYTFSTDEGKDLSAVVDHFRPQYERIHLLGFSMGAALVIIHAAQAKNVQSVIAVSAPTDFAKVESHWFLPAAWIPTFQKGELWRACSIRIGKLFAPKPAAIDCVKEVAPAPLLLLAGGEDPTVFAWHAKALYEAAGDPKAIEIFEHSEHAEDLWRNEPERFIKIVRNWLGE